MFKGIDGQTGICYCLSSAFYWHIFTRIGHLVMGTWEVGLSESVLKNVHFKKGFSGCLHNDVVPDVPNYVVENVPVKTYRHILWFLFYVSLINHVC